MATTQNTYTGNGSLTEYSFTFPYLEESDVRVSLDGVDQLTTAYSFANATTISFNTAPANGVAIRIYRQTAQEAPPATFFAGSAIRASDLNDNFLQQLYVAQETDQIARNLTAGEIAPGGITNVQLADDAVTTIKIVDLNVTTAKINDSAVTSAKIADGTIVNADVNASAAIAGTKVSPNFGSQNVVTTGDVSAVDATISGTATISGLVYPTSDGSADQVLKTNGSGTLSFASAAVYQGPAFRATLSAGAFFTPNTDTKVPYDTVTFDTDSCYDNTTNYRFTPTKAGYYLTTASCSITFGAGGHPNILTHYITVDKNGSTYAWGNHSRYSTSTSEWFIGTQSCTTLVYMNGSTDYLEGYVWSNDVNPSTQANLGSFFESTWVHD